MTVNQGLMLMKLVDRECDKTTTDLIKAYKGSFYCFFLAGCGQTFRIKSEIGVRCRQSG